MYGLLLFVMVCGQRLLILAAGLLGVFLLLPEAQAQTATSCSLDISDAVAVLLTVPADTALGEAFGLGFTVPISAYLVAYLVGLFVSMFDH